MFLEKTIIEEDINKVVKSFDQNGITFFKTGNLNDEDEIVTCIPVTLNRDFDEKIHKIRVIGYNQDSFKENFKTIFNSSTNIITNNFNKNIKSNNEFLENDLRKSLYTDYFAGRHRLSSTKKDYIFDINKYKSLIFGTNNNISSDDSVYKLILDRNFCNELKSQRITKIKIEILDSFNSIIDFIDFFDFDINTRLRQSDSIDNLDNSLKNLLAKDFIDSILLFDKNNFNDEAIIRVNKALLSEINDSSYNVFIFPSIIDKSTGNIVQLDLMSGSSLIFLSETQTFGAFDHTFIILSQGPGSSSSRNLFLEFYYENIDRIDNFNIRFNVQFKWSRPGNYRIRILSKYITLEYSKLKSFIDFFTDEYAVNKLDSLSFNTFENNSYILNSKSNFNVPLSNYSSLPDNVKKSIVVSSIKINNIEKDFIYKDSNFTTSNKVFYRNKPVSDFIIDGNFNFWHLQYSPQATYEINFKFVEISATPFNKENIIEIASKIYTFNSGTFPLINYKNYSNSIGNFNLIFKENLNIDIVEVNKFINNTNKNLINYSNIYIDNISELINSAALFGYFNEQQNTTDIKLFLENCLVKVQVNTQINNNKSIKSNKSIICRFDEMFDTTNLSINSTILNARESFIDKIENNINFIANIFQLKNSFFSYLKSQDQNKRLSNITSDSFSLQNSIAVKILPIPKIIIGNLYAGLDEDDNIVGASRELNLKVLNYLTSNNISINNDIVYNKLRRSLFQNTEESPSIDNLNYFFDYMYSKNVRSNQIPKKVYSYDESDILRIFENINQERLTITNYLDSQLEQRYFNFDDNSQNFFVSDFPFSFNVSKYLNNNNGFTFRTLNIANSGNDLSINASYLNSMYSLAEIRSFKPYIKMSMHFLILAENNYVSQSNDAAENKNLKNILYDENQYITTSMDYLNDTKKSFYDNFNFHLSDNLVELEVSESQTIIKIKNNRSLDINSLSLNSLNTFLNSSREYGLNCLEKIILRISICIEKSDDEFIDLFLSKEINRTNLLNQKLLLDTITSIRTQNT